MAILMKYPVCLIAERFEPAADVTSKFLNGFLSSVSPIKQDSVTNSIVQENIYFSTAKLSATLQISHLFPKTRISKSVCVKIQPAACSYTAII